MTGIREKTIKLHRRLSKGFKYHYQEQRSFLAYWDRQPVLQRDLITVQIPSPHGCLQGALAVLQPGTPHSLTLSTEQRLLTSWFLRLSSTTIFWNPLPMYYPNQQPHNHSQIWDFRMSRVQRRTLEESKLSHSSGDQGRLPGRVVVLWPAICS